MIFAMFFFNTLLSTSVYMLSFIGNAMAVAFVVVYSSMHFFFLHFTHSFFLLPVQLVYCLFLVAKPIEWPNRCLYLSVGVHCGTQVESTQQIAMVQSNFKTFTTLIITG